MRTIAALVAGLMLSTLTFVAGLAIALTFLNIDEPDHRLDTSNTTALWSTEPQVVDSKTQHFERVAARPVAKPQVEKDRKVASLDTSATLARQLIDQASTPDRALQDPSIDPITTGAIDRKAPDQQAAIRQAQSAAHVEWCSRRYRSYNAESNTYRPYGGGARDCRSPYSDFAAALPDTSADDRASMTATAEDRIQQADEPSMERVSYDDGAIPDANSDHIASCFDRYRSYRPDDNSYQPYDGGPRQQCE
jgi:hypothetical protein